MTWFLGALLATGVLLCASPWLWPAHTAPASRPARSDALTKLLAEAGFSETASRTALTGIAGVGALAAAVIWLLTMHPVLALLAAVAGGSAPIVFLTSRRQRRRTQRRQLWPDVCDLLIASIRVGQSLPDAVSALSVSAPADLRPAFHAFERDLHATGRFEDALDRLKRNLADPVADRIIETLRMARQVGGTELTHVLRALSTSVRADAALRGEVEARQSWVRGAAVLGVIAPWAILGMLVARPEGAQAYATPTGALLILVGAGVCVVAFRLMLRLGRLSEPGRWFE